MYLLAVNHRKVYPFAARGHVPDLERYGHFSPVLSNAICHMRTQTSHINCNSQVTGNRGIRRAGNGRAKSVIGNRRISRAKKGNQTWEPGKLYFSIVYLVRRGHGHKKKYPMSLGEHQIQVLPVRGPLTTRGRNGITRLDWCRNPIFTKLYVSGVVSWSEENPGSWCTIDSSRV